MSEVIGLGEKGVMVHTLPDLPFLHEEEDNSELCENELGGRLGCNGRKSRIPRVDRESGWLFKRQDLTNEDK